MQTWFSTLLTSLSIPAVGLPAVFLWTMASATLLPLGSEAVVFAYIKLKPELFWSTVLVATMGNTLGGMVNYWLAYGTHQVIARDHPAPRALAWCERLGPKTLFFSFLPVVGDPLTAIAGWLKLPWLPCLLWQALGKFVRYALLTALLLGVPDSFWHSILIWVKDIA